jgi:hypothetical protein
MSLSTLDSPHHLTSLLLALHHLMSLLLAVHLLRVQLALNKDTVFLNTFGVP